MSRYENYLRGKKVPQDMKHPIVRMPPPEAVNLFDRHTAPRYYDDPAPNFGAASIEPINKC